jgi:EAL domain-containing protein (putative c-di-GMP-specific phosphodiesterase class I)
MAWPGELSVAVNLSARQLADDLVGTVRAALEQSGLPAERLWLEVTETAMFADVPSAAQVLREIARLGVHISLDDFGTGYSSMAYLRDFPVHSLKIDRSFVAGLGTSADDSAIVATLVSLAASLDLWVTAEGVETPRQLAALRRLGCEFGQGYLWSKAVPNAEFVEVLGRHELQRDLSAVPSRRARSGPADVTPDVFAQIMSMHRQGASPSSIAAALNRESVPAPGGKRWHHVAVAHVITAAPKRG